MKFVPQNPPRVFEVGHGSVIRLKDCGRVTLEPDEQVTFLADGAEYDVVRKEWGFYATPSLNGRLERFGLRAVLVNSTNGKYFVFLVLRGKEPQFENYLNVQGHQVVAWLDSDAALQTLERKVKG
jgi:hypothetical protein